MIASMPDWLEGLLLAVTFGCGVTISGLHVWNRRFIAPVYDVILNLTAFTSASIVSIWLGHFWSSLFAVSAVLAWVWLAIRTARRARHERVRQLGGGLRRSAVSLGGEDQGSRFQSDA